MTPFFEVGDEWANLVLTVSFLAIFFFVALAWAPWRRFFPRARWPLAFPLFAFLFYGIYEWYMPSRFDIRVDLLLIWPLLFSMFSRIRLYRRMSEHSD